MIMHAHVITGNLEGIFGQRLLSRKYDIFDGVIFINISLVWLLVIFTFEFAYFQMCVSCARIYI